MLKTASSVTINTGNVLNLIDIKKKAGQNVTEELSESIKLTLSEWKDKENGPTVNGFHHDEKPSHAADTSSKTAGAKGALHNGPEVKGASSNAPVAKGTVTNGPRTPESVLTITRPTDDAKDKMAEEERKNFKIGVKIFINEDSVAAITECLESVFSALHTDRIDNVILAYNPPTSPDASHASTATPRLPHTGSSLVKMSTSTDVDADNDTDALKCDALLPGIKVLWEVLEDYVKRGRVSQLGVADIGGGCLRRLHAWARVRPSIAQINLASCCVVPPTLHAFCKANHVQLLTHADPPDLLSAATPKALEGSELICESLDWCARYQVHIKCRGVLALKGYVCRATAQSQ